VEDGTAVERVKRRRPFCADLSRTREEPLGATASRIDNWILVEYRGAWRRDILGGSLLSPKLKTHLREHLELLRPARLLFVKQPERRAESGRRVFLASTTPGAERLLGLEVEHQDDLRDVDLADALAGGDAPFHPIADPVLVVCTHGKRDRCCARYGGPLYDALRAAAPPGEVWQSSHVGGDRFAGNVVVLPEGLFFGRVGEEDLDPILDDYFDGRIHLSAIAGGRPTPSPCRRPSAPFARGRGSPESTTSSSPR